MNKLRHILFDVVDHSSMLLIGYIAKFILRREGRALEELLLLR